MLAVISVSKSYIHRGNHRHKRDTKKHWYVYFIDDDGQFKSKRVSSIQAAYYKTRIKHRYRFFCRNCGSKYI